MPRLAGRPVLLSHGMSDPLLSFHVAGHLRDLLVDAGADGRGHRDGAAGEVLVGDNHRSKLDVTTDLQAFALIVTAEPYYAVRRPSNVVILENMIRPDTVGTSEAVDAKYELIDRGGYIPTGYHFDPVVLNSKLPLEFFEARNAVRIAKSDGAENYAAPSYEKAAAQMKRADDLATMKHVDRKGLISLSREVVQTADDSREIAVKRIDADREPFRRGAGVGIIDAGLVPIAVPAILARVGSRRETGERGQQSRHPEQRHG